MASAPSSSRPALQFDGEFLQRLEVLNVIAKKIMAGLLRADRKSARKGVSAEFADHRSYVPGDDIRHVEPTTEVGRGRRIRSSLGAQCVEIDFIGPA